MTQDSTLDTQQGGFQIFFYPFPWWLKNFEEWAWSMGIYIFILFIKSYSKVQGKTSKLITGRGRESISNTLRIYKFQIII